MELLKQMYQAYDVETHKKFKTRNDKQKAIKDAKKKGLSHVAVIRILNNKPKIVRFEEV